MPGFSNTQDLQQIGAGGELSTSEEALITDLAAVATTPAGSFLTKTGASSFANTTLTGFTKLDTTHSPVALYNFEDNLNDTSGGSLNLSLGAGTARYTYGVHGLKGLYLDGATYLQRASADAALTITGDITVQAIIQFEDLAETARIVSYGVNSETEANNVLYTFGVKTDYELFYRAEKDAGTDISDDNDDYVVMPGVLCHLAFVRSSNDITYYMNGQAIGNASSGLSAPTGGGTSRLVISGASSDADPSISSVKGFLGSVKIVASALSAAQILTEAKLTGFAPPSAS